MSTSMSLHLRAGEKLYLNGAVIKVDRKVSIEVLNDVTFLLGSHVMQPADATTPLRQLYFVVQSALMDPASAQQITGLIEDMLARTIQSFENREVLEGLRTVGEKVEAGRFFEALRAIRSLYPLEEEILLSGRARVRAA